MNRRNPAPKEPLIERSRRYTKQEVVVLLALGCAFWGFDYRKTACILLLLACASLLLHIRRLGKGGPA